jgi:hypothetical protein
MAENQNNPMQRRCKAKCKRTGEPCKNWALPGKTVCRMHGASGGPPRGSQNARRHGLFAAIVQTPEGRAAYQDARRVASTDLAKDSAALLVAKITEAYAVPGKAPKVVDEIDALLMAKVVAQELDYDVASAIMRHLRAPHVTQLAKALAPLKNLLDKADGVDDEVKLAAIALKREQLEIERTRAGVDEDAEAKLPAAIPAHSDAWLALVSGHGQGMDAE